MDSNPHNLADPQHFISRQMSWVDFNRRVLELAGETTLPVLERLRFLAISGENLDGWFMKRYAGLQREIELGVPRDWPTPMTAAEELAAVTAAIDRLQADQVRCLRDQLLPELAAAGVALLDYTALDRDSQAAADHYFDHELFPILTPLAVDPGRPFPFISNLSLSLAVVLRLEGEEAPLFARVKVPANRDRWVRVGADRTYVPIEQVIAANLERLFRRLTIVAAHPFRVTRSADVARDDAAADDLLDFAVDLVRERRFAPAVRIEVDATMPAEACELLTKELHLQPTQVFRVQGLLGYRDLLSFCEREQPAPRRPAWEPQPHPRFAALDADSPPAALFDVIRERDVLVHHPYHDYEQTVVAFLQAAAADPDVLAIKQSLYRTSDKASTLQALLRAAEAGKEVTALLELKARLDEAHNVAWAQRLEDSGIHTSYGFVGFKTHTRLTMVVRQEPDGLRPYVHFSTGDYNDETARSYSDIGLFTAEPEIAKDVIEFFNFLTGYADVPSYHRLVVAPTDLRNSLRQRIDVEIANARAGRPARIVAMMNALVDASLSLALFEASEAGVTVDLIVRGECGLKPGLPHVSDRITVRSVLGPFLEHARVFWFANNGDDLVAISSADWMYRNLDHRVEAAVTIEDKANRQQLKDLLELYLTETAMAWELGPDGVWSRLRPAPGEAPVSVQETLMARALAAQRSINTSPPSTLTG